MRCKPLIEYSWEIGGLTRKYILGKVEREEQTEKMPKIYNRSTQLYVYIDLYKSRSVHDTTERKNILIRFFAGVNTTNSQIDE